MVELQHQYIKTNGIQLHVTFAGPESGEPVLLLHGFPEFWYGWYHQIHYLANQGYRVIAPDQRGYNLSDKPQGIRAYWLDKLTADILGLMSALGYNEVILGGHDWGATVAWELAQWHPERFKKLIIVNNGHSIAFLKQSMKLSQMRKSWYIYFFQLPSIPENNLTKNNFHMLFNKFLGPGTGFTEDDFELYREAWSQNGAIQSTINWYRTIPWQIPSTLYRYWQAGGVKITMPTLAIWGTRDHALNEALIHDSIRDCDEVDLVLLDASHWVLHDMPDETNASILKFLQK